MLPLDRPAGDLCRRIVNGDILPLPAEAAIAKGPFECALSHRCSSTDGYGSHIEALRARALDPRLAGI